MSVRGDDATNQMENSRQFSCWRSSETKPAHKSWRGAKRQFADILARKIAMVVAYLVAYRAPAHESWPPRRNDLRPNIPAAIPYNFLISRR